MHVFTSIVDFFQLMNFNLALVGPFLIITIISILGFLCFFFYLMQPVQKLEIPEHWKNCEKTFRMIDRLALFAKIRLMAELRDSLKTVIKIVNVKKPRAEIHYSDVMNPYKYLTPQICGCALLRRP